MEVAGQWRREWAGTAEYGKVTEGGVTRKVARAMEVLHASAPGARVRVLRAAYHSTSGPGEPASSFLLHSSRRVISSGYNFIEPETSLTKPLEISSTPLESSPEIEVEKENYKVTEPDDFEISEPSKWRGSKNINSLRMPSEESSSTDNTSVIDLDYNIKNTLKKSSEKFIAQKRITPISSLLDAPVTLNTLKYKSLLNGSDSWNNRRKSYSFEETPEIEESSLRESDALTMESSTDSGICKSTEIVNDNLDNSRYVERKTKMEDIREETFKDWLSKNRQKPYRNQVKTNKEPFIGEERKDESNITLQSTGKVLITLQQPIKTINDYETKNSHVIDDSDRRTKKVEFCKTELHFAAESGTVNIIATDEKPPPSNDFRKKRSVFVPMTDYVGDKSITLFGEKSDILEVNKLENSCIMNQVKTIDENTAATKSILKNKIPKPKPYLLGENMAFGDSVNLTVKDDLNHNFAKPSRVSLINKQLQIERFSNESKSSSETETDWNNFQKSNARTNKIGPANSIDSNQVTVQSLSKSQQIEKDLSTTIKSKLKMLQMSETALSHPKTRQLRESDLTYFGVAKPDKTINEKRKHSLDSIYNEKDEILQSVKLVKLISSVCNSEVDSDEAPDYENLPIKYNFTPKPAPRSRSNYDTHLEEKKDPRNLNPILERDVETVTVQSRRIKMRQEVLTPNSRSISEPPKASRQKAIERSSRAHSKTYQVEDSLPQRNNTNTKEKSPRSKISRENVPEKRISVSPLYVNLKETKKRSDETNRLLKKENSNEEKKSEKKYDDLKGPLNVADNKNSSKCDNNVNVTVKRGDSGKRKINEQRSERKNYKELRTKILVTPEKSPSKSSESTYKKHRNADKCSSDEKNVISPSLTQKMRKGRKEYLVSTGDSISKDKKLHRDQEHKKTETSTLAVNISDTTNKQNMRPKLTSDTTGDEPVLIEKNNTQTKGVDCEGMTRHHHHQSSPVKAHKTDKNENTLNKSKRNDNTQNKSRRSKYVINYDDKNGTVSSVCKIKPGHGSSRKKMSNYETKDNLNDHTPRKNINKTDLLQLPEQRMEIQR